MVCELILCSLNFFKILEGSWWVILGFFFQGNWMYIWGTFKQFTIISCECDLPINLICLSLINFELTNIYWMLVVSGKNHLMLLEYTVISSVETSRLLNHLSMAVTISLKSIYTYLEAFWQE